MIFYMYYGYNFNNNHINFFATFCEFGNFFAIFLRVWQLLATFTINGKTHSSKYQFINCSTHTKYSMNKNAKNEQKNQNNEKLSFGKYEILYNNSKYYCKKNISHGNIHVPNTMNTFFGFSQRIFIYRKI